MMSAAVKGRTTAEARALTRAFKSMMSLHESSLDGDDRRPEVRAKRRGSTSSSVTWRRCRGVVKFPVRIKCATLAWNTLIQGLDEATATS